MSDTCPGDKFREGVVTPSACETIKEEVIRQKILGLLLTEKGFLPEDLEEEVPFELVTAQEVFLLRVSFIIRLNGKPVVLMKCGPGSVLARERAALALARLFGEVQIPLTVVTNGEDATLLDTLAGETLDCGLGAIPTKSALLAQSPGFQFLPLAEKRLKLEKQILSAFEALGLHGECH
jgi:hypothetical protein